MLRIDRQNRIKNLFSDALELDLAARDSFLDSATGDDPTICFEVRQLLAVHERAGGFLLDPTPPIVDGPASGRVAIGESLCSKRRNYCRSIFFSSITRFHRAISRAIWSRIWSGVV